jgi:hypothetical protein
MADFGLIGNAPCCPEIVRDGDSNLAPLFCPSKKQAGHLLVALPLRSPRTLPAIETP